MYLVLLPCHYHLLRCVAVGRQRRTPAIDGRLSWKLRSGQSILLLLIPSQYNANNGSSKLMPCNSFLVMPLPRAHASLSNTSIACYVLLTMTTRLLTCPERNARFELRPQNNFIPSMHPCQDDPEANAQGSVQTITTHTNTNLAINKVYNCTPQNPLPPQTPTAPILGAQLKLLTSNPHSHVALGPRS